jgi:glycosyltransferase involved in cell wall biosynthesis
MYNSLEERALIQGVSKNENVPSVVVGVGSAVPEKVQPDRFRDSSGIREPFILYIGRIDENKGCAEMFDYFCRYEVADKNLNLVLIGNQVMDVPSHPRIKHLGFVNDETKFDALAAADVLIMPSYFESLSMVTLEAWALGLPVIVNGSCDVLRGQVVRSNAGLYYTNQAEFTESLDLLESHPSLRAALGANGQKYFSQHYTWPVVEKKYLTMLDQLKREEINGINNVLEPLPSWFDRRTRKIPPAIELLGDVPSGPVLVDES